MIVKSDFYALVFVAFVVVMQGLTIVLVAVEP